MKIERQLELMGHYVDIFKPKTRVAIWSGLNLYCLGEWSLLNLKADRHSATAQTIPLTDQVLDRKWVDLEASENNWTFKSPGARLKINKMLDIPIPPTIKPVGGEETHLTKLQIESMIIPMPKLLKLIQRVSDWVWLYGDWVARTGGATVTLSRGTASALKDPIGLPVEVVEFLGRTQSEAKIQVPAAGEYGSCEITGNDFILRTATGASVQGVTGHIYKNVVGKLGEVKWNAAPSTLGQMLSELGSFKSTIGMVKAEIYPNGVNVSSPEVGVLQLGDTEGCPVFIAEAKALASAPSWITLLAWGFMDDNKTIVFRFVGEVYYLCRQHV